MTTSSALPRPRVLADALPGGLARDASLVLGGAVFTGALAQFAIPLPFTPVPLTLGTLAALLVGSALGSVRGLAALALYALAGAAGVPWFAGGVSGTGSVSFGYVLGFVAAAFLVGRLAERGADRTALRTAGLMALGNVVIYAFGVPYLAVSTGRGLGFALAAGVVPFILGDLLKIAVAAGLLPGAWRLVRAFEGR